MTARTPRPPAHVEPYVRALGVDGAIRFFLAFGGAGVYLSERSTARSRIVQEFGDGAMRALADALGAGEVEAVPVPKRWMAQAMLMRGDGVAEIARQLHVAERSVRRWAETIAEERGESRQASLFDLL